MVWPRKIALRRGTTDRIDARTDQIEATYTEVVRRTVTAIAGGALLVSSLSACAGGGNGNALPASTLPSQIAVAGATQTRAAEPGQTAKPTPDPNAISMERILGEAASNIEISRAIGGKVYIREDRKDLNLPGVAIAVTLAIAKDVATREQLPFTEISLNPYFSREGGRQPSAQIVASMAWAHFNAWQHDQDDRYYTERKRLYVDEYLKMVSEGGDGSHLVWAVTENGKIYPNEQVRVEVNTPTVIVFVDEAPHGQISETLYDRNQGTLIFRVFLDRHNEYPEVFQSEEMAYINFTLAISWMSLPSDIQRLGANRAGIPDEKFGLILRGVSQSMWPSVSSPNAKTFSPFIATSPTQPRW